MSTFTDNQAASRARANARRRDFCKAALPIMQAASDTLPAEYYLTSWSFTTDGILGQLGHAVGIDDAEIRDMAARTAAALGLEYAEDRMDEYVHVCARGQFKGTHLELWSHVERTYEQHEGSL